MTAKILLVVALLAASLGGAERAGAGGLPSSQVTVMRHGITMTLRLPGVTFPRGALVQAVLTMKNVSKSTLSFGISSCRADGPSPTVEVLDQANRIVFPSALPPPPLANVPCVQVGVPQEAPGQMVSKTFSVLLRGSQVRARVSVVGVNGVSIVQTPVLHMHLGNRDAPSIRFTASGGVRAVVTLPPGVRRAPLYYTDWYVCGHGKDAYVAGTVFEEQLPNDGRIPYPMYGGLVMQWVRAHDMQITAICARPQQWHVAVAVLGETVSYGTYNEPKPAAPA